LEVFIGSNKNYAKTLTNYILSDIIKILQLISGGRRADADLTDPVAISYMGLPASGTG